MTKTYMSEKDLIILETVLRSKDYEWRERADNRRKVILTNPEKLKHAGLMPCAMLFTGTGHTAWEVIMGAWLVVAVGKSLDTGNECDITQIFNTDFLASPEARSKENRKLTKEQIYDRIIKLFTIQEDSEEVLKLAIAMD